MKETKIKKFKSNKEKIVIIFDIFAIILFFMFILKNKDNRFLEVINIYNDDITVTIFLMLILILDAMMNFFSKYYVLIAIYLAFRTLCIKLIRKREQSKIQNNVLYYREKIINVTPAEISLISNLKIEHKKDISATILDLYRKNILDFKDYKIIVKNINDNINLKKSEYEILNMIKENDFSIQRINKWENICIQEALNDKYIKLKDDLIREIFASSIFLICSIFIVLTLRSGISSKIDNVYKELRMRNGNILSQYMNIGESDESKIETLKNNNEVKEAVRNIIIDTGLLIMTIIFCSLFVFILMIIPIYFIIKILYEIIMAKDSLIIRTKKGKILAEQIKGMKNYIHDFSYLSERNKENVVIWDDFLIYAVVLEENEKIVDDILKYNNINIGLLNEIKQILVSYLK